MSRSYSPVRHTYVPAIDPRPPGTSTMPSVQCVRNFTLCSAFTTQLSDLLVDVTFIQYRYFMSQATRKFPYVNIAAVNNTFAHLVSSIDFHWGFTVCSQEGEVRGAPTLALWVIRARPYSSGPEMGQVSVCASVWSVCLFVCWSSRILACLTPSPSLPSFRPCDRSRRLICNRSSSPSRLVILLGDPSYLRRLLVSRPGDCSRRP